jgi:nucleotide-binding universal stress UspA family protein
MVSQGEVLHLILGKRSNREEAMSTTLEQVTTKETIPDEIDLNLRKIVVPVDLSEHSEQTASYAVALAKAFGASLVFVHVFPPEAITEFTTEDVHEIYEREREIAKERLTSFGNKIGRIYPHCDTEFYVGDTADRVKEAALTAKADLIITATYHPGFLGRLFALEQAPRIVNRAPCPVLVYHEAQE